MSLRLGIDIGTSGVRTAVLDGDNVIATARAEHLRQDSDRIDAEKWWVAVQNCLHAQLKNLIKSGREPAAISALAIDGTSGSMVMTDAQLRPVSRSLMYNSNGFDKEAALIALHAADPHITRGGNSALARAMHLASEAGSNATHLLHQADFIMAKFLGYGGISDYNNALKTGFDPEFGTWPDWVDQIIDPTLLPKVVEAGAPIQSISSDIAREFGLSENVVIHAGTTDSIAAFLACAPIQDGVAVTSLGTTLAIKMLSSTRIDDPATGLYSHKLGDFWLVGGASNTGGGVLANFFTPQEITDLSEQIDPDVPTDLDFYPLLNPGERFPINDPNLQPRLDPRPDSDVTFLQAILEGIANIESRCYREIEAQGGGKPTLIYSAGGGANNDPWTKIRAKALGQTPQIAEHSEAAIGTAKLIAQT